MKPYPHTSARIICDSIHPNRSRLTTFELTYPRYIHSELMTHRVFSRNAQSSRAIPVKKRIEKVRNNPVMPIRWGANQSGMQAKDEEIDADPAQYTWECAAKAAAQQAEFLMKQGLHKQWINRLLEPFDTITVVVTATHWQNFFGLRCHPDAQPEFQNLAWKMADLYYWHEVDLPGWCELAKSPGLQVPEKPTPLQEGEWHLPYVSTAEIIDDIGATTQRDTVPTYSVLAKCSVARCARVSYLNHDSSDPDIDKDVALHDRLLEAGHMSPFEHQAVLIQGRPMENVELLTGNFSHGWAQYRKLLSTPEIRTFNYLEAMKLRSSFNTD